MLFLFLTLIACQRPDDTACEDLCAEDPMETGDTSEEEGLGFEVVDVAWRMLEAPVWDPTLTYHQEEYRDIEICFMFSGEGEIDLWSSEHGLLTVDDAGSWATTSDGVFSVSWPDLSAADPDLTPLQRFTWTSHEMVVTEGPFPADAIPVADDCTASPN